MTLPNIGTARHEHELDFGDTVVVFRIQPVAGALYNQIIDAHKDDDGKAPHELVAVPILQAAVVEVGTRTDAGVDWVEFTDGDAVDLWGTWPEWARFSLYLAAVKYSTTGPSDPFVSPRQRKTAAS